MVFLFFLLEINQRCCLEDLHERNKGNLSFCVIHCVRQCIIRKSPKGISKVLHSYFLRHLLDSPLFLSLTSFSQLSHLFLWILMKQLMSLRTAVARSSASEGYIMKENMELWSHTQKNRVNHLEEGLEKLRLVCLSWVHEHMSPDFVFRDVSKDQSQEDKQNEMMFHRVQGM
jgi:hypothetical protein